LFREPVTVVEKPEVRAKEVEQSQPTHIEDEDELPQETEEEKQDKLRRTIFVGNVHISFKQKELQKVFDRFGAVDKVWFRSVPVESNKMGPKASFILKKVNLKLI